MTSAGAVCREGCGACCIAPSISTLNKAAGVACSHLDDDLRCKLFASAARPACCSGLQPSTEMCGNSPLEALQWLNHLERLTLP